MKKKRKKKRSLRDKLSKEENLWCTQYAFNSLFSGWRFTQHLVALGEGIQKDLRQFSEECARKIIERRGRKAEDVTLGRVAEMAYESLLKLPEKERQARVRAIQKIKVSAPKKKASTAQIERAVSHRTKE